MKLVIRLRALVRPLLLFRFFESLKILGWKAFLGSRVELGVLPYNPYALSMISEHHSSSDLVLVYEKGKEQVLDREPEVVKIAEKMLQLNFPRARVLSVELKDFQLNGSYDLLDRGCFSNKGLSPKNKFWILNSLVYLFRRFEMKDTRSPGLLGLFFMFFEYVKILWPSALVWPVFFETSVDFAGLSASFLSGIGFFSFAGLFRSLLELPTETKYFQQDREILCGNNFILGGYSIRSVPIFYLSLFFLIGMYGATKSVIGSLAALFSAFVYYVTYLSRPMVKFFSVLGSIILFQLVFQWKFAIVFFKNIFCG